MSVTLLCPECGVLSRFDSAELRRCFSCGEALPSELIAAGTRALGRSGVLSFVFRVVFRGVREWDGAAVVLSCPSCRVASTFDRNDQVTCRSCNERLPGEAALAVLRSLRRSRPPGLTIGLWTSLFAMLGLLVVGITVIKALLAHEMPRGSSALSLACVVVFAAWLMAIAYGIHNERTWVRPWAVAFWVAPIPFEVWIPGTVMNDPVGGTCMLTTAALVAAWYFYFKERVVEYYEEL